MYVEYPTEGSIQLDGVTFSGPAEGVGTTMSWTGLKTPIDANLNIVDFDNDMMLDWNVDSYNGSTFAYTGYTITSGGREYAVFSRGDTYIIALPQNGSTQNIIPTSGTSNVWQYEASAYPFCFCEGTLIATPDGERLVEALEIGDSLLLLDGTMARVKWIGRQTVSTRFGPAERLMPVRIAAGALGNGLPHSDLTVTADHALLVDGVLCNAGALVNGSTITRVPLAEMGGTYTVYHIETDAHEIILANGAPAETFIDNVSRRAFDNYAEFEALYGDVPEMQEHPRPRAMSARQVPSRVRLMLANKDVA